jgi:hypothetical protein
MTTTTERNDGMKSKGYCFCSHDLGVHTHFNRLSYCGVCSCRGYTTTSRIPFLSNIRYRRWQAKDIKRREVMRRHPANQSIELLPNNRFEDSITYEVCYRDGRMERREIHVHPSTK